MAFCHLRHLSAVIYKYRLPIVAMGDRHDIYLQMPLRATCTPLVLGPTLAVWLLCVRASLVCLSLLSLSLLLFCLVLSERMKGGTAWTVCNAIELNLMGRTSWRKLIRSMSHALSELESWISLKESYKPCCSHFIHRHPSMVLNHWPHRTVYLPGTNSERLQSADCLQWVEWVELSPWMDERTDGRTNELLNPMILNQQIKWIEWVAWVDWVKWPPNTKPEFLSAMAFCHSFRWPVILHLREPATCRCPLGWFEWNGKDIMRKCMSSFFSGSMAHARHFETQKWHN